MAHLPEGGFAAARTDVLDLSMVVIPALATEMVCCSMACKPSQILHPGRQYAAFGPGPGILSDIHAKHQGFSEW